MGPRLRGDDVEFQNRGNKAGMYMKTKDKVKKSGSAGRRFCGLRLFRARRGRTADRELGGPRYIKIVGTKLLSI